MGELTPSSRYTLPKAEKLTSKNEIALLFKAGQSFFAPPFQIKFIAVRENIHTTIHVAFAVSKRKLPLAISRNRMKRLMREAYRLNNALLKSNLLKNGTALSVIFLYNGNSVTTFNETEDKIKLLLKRLDAYCRNF